MNTKLNEEIYTHLMECYHIRIWPVYTIKERRAANKTNVTELRPKAILGWVSEDVTGDFVEGVLDELRNPRG